MSRYIVIGAGALGALLTAQWTIARVPAVLVGRGRSLEVIARDGVRIRRPEGDEVVPVDVVGSISQARPTLSDTVVLAVKSQDAEAAIAAIAWVALDDGRGVVADLPLLTLQNGLATEEFALRRFDRVIGVSIGIPASHLEPGVIVSPARPVVGVAWLGGYPSSLPGEEERHRAALASAQFSACIEPDIAAAKRRKLIANLRNVVDVFSAPLEDAELAEQLLADEARNVFADAGLTVAPPPRDTPPLLIGDVPGHEAGHLSTWQSFARGTSSEVDYLSGEVALIARSHGLTAPLNTAVARELGALAARGGRPGEIGLPAEFASESRSYAIGSASMTLTGLSPLISTDAASLRAATSDRSGWPGAAAPRGVVRAQSVDDVRAALAWAHATATPVIARGGGSGLAGGSAGVAGAIVLDLSALDIILAIDPDEQLARVQAGVITADLDAAAAAAGLMYAPDPGSVGISTIGGNIATNAGGLRGAKYGVTRDHVLALDVVLADGTLLHIGRDTLKGVTGYDLVGLFTGSEGTLGVIVGATLRLLPRPVHTATLAAFFADVETAAQAVTAVTRSGARPAVLEIVDGPTLAAIDTIEGTDLRSRGDAFLLIQTDGFGAAEELALISAALGPFATLIETATDAAASDRLLFARRRALPALEQLGHALIEDIAVPRSRLADAVRRIREIGDDEGVRIFVFGHAGDGNLHPIIVTERASGSATAVPGTDIPPAAQRAADRIFALALELGGTITAEHGVGRLKREWAAKELGPDVHALQDRLRELFDPRGILNPGSSL